MSAGRNKNSRSRTRKAQRHKVRHRKGIAKIQRRQHHAQQRQVWRKWKAYFRSMLGE